MNLTFHSVKKSKDYMKIRNKSGKNLENPETGKEYHF